MRKTGLAAGDRELAARARTRIDGLPTPQLQACSTTARISQPFFRVLTGYIDQVSSVAVTPDGTGS